MSTMTYETRPLPARNESLCAADTPLLRPGPQDLSETIPVFFIGRNTHGHWVARGADGKSGGLFWRKQAAIRFARRSVWPARCVFGQKPTTVSTPSSPPKPPSRRSLRSC